jgi:uncharacterized protein
LLFHDFFLHPYPDYMDTLIITDTTIAAENTTDTNARVAAPRPVDTADRLQTIDMIRGVALLGILMMNIPGFGIHWSVYPEIIKDPATMLILLRSK